MRTIKISSSQIVIALSSLFIVLSIILKSIDTGLIGAISVLLMFELKAENEKNCLFWSSGVFLIGIIWLALQKFNIIKSPPICGYMLCCCLAALATRGAIDNIAKFSKPRKLFSQKAVWVSVESDSRWVFFGFYCALASGLLSFSGSLRLATLVLLFLLWVILVLRLVSGYTFLMSREKEKELRKILNCYLRNSEETNSPDIIEDMRDMYDKIEKYFLTSKAYLNAGYTLQELATSVFTNKTYVSKTINVITGKNFRQFVNSFRVQYAMGLIDENPNLHVEELADKSGFNSAVSFNMAFKLHQGETPGERIQRMRERTMQN